MLLQCLVGLLEPTSGEVLYDHRNFVAMNKKEKIRMRREMGMISKVLLVRFAHCFRKCSFSS